MPCNATNRLIKQFERALHRRDGDAALATLGELEALHPRDPTWPKRIAELHAGASDHTAELSALSRALRLQVEAEQTSRAIATATRILKLDPGNHEAEERLHLLYTSPPGSGADPSAPRTPDVEPAKLVREDRSNADHAPLNEIVLTEVVANARPVMLADPEQTGAAEIPLDTHESTQQLELYLDTLAPNSAIGADADDPGDAKPRPEPVDEQALRATLLASLSRAEIDRLVAQSQIIEAPAGAECFHQGDRADRIYVILDGSMLPVAEDSKVASKGTRMGILEAGDFFGEIGLLTRQPRNASVRALVPTRLLAINRPTIRHLLGTHREILGLVLRTLRYRLVDRLVRTSPLFACFAKAERAEFARQFRLLEVRDGTTIIREGLPDQGLFVILAGQVDVTQSSHEGEKTLATLGHDEIFGELAVLFGQPAIATVTARSKCWLFRLSESRFRKILDHNPQLRELLLALGEGRARSNRMQYLTQQEPETRQ